MTTVVAQSNYIFGLRKNVINNICFIDEHTVIFPAGNNCVRYNTDQKWQRFIPGTENSKGMQAMALSPNRRYLAVAERGDKATITVHDLQHEQGRKKKIQGVGDLAAEEFVYMDFSPDSKYLIGQTGAPEWMLILWLWEKNKVLSTIRSSVTLPVNQVSFNPNNNTQMCVSGFAALKLFRYAEGALKQSNAAKIESFNLLCHTWMSEDRMIAGTDTGRLLVFESGDLRWEVNFASEPEESDRQTDKKLSDAKAEGQPTNSRITSILSYSKGFACSCGPGNVFLFEKSEEKDNYQQTREIRIPPDPCSSDPSQATLQEVCTLCISPSEETLTLTTNGGQIYSINLSTAESSKGEPARFEYLSDPFHSKPITGLSICIRKPLIATCSLDCSVRIWNFETNVLELYKEFQEETYSVALHTSGLFIMVGFPDKLRMMNLLIDDIRTFNSFNVRACREVVFSHGGHMFAAISGNIIHIYSVATFEDVLVLKGHNRNVSAITWSLDDSRLVSCGEDGAVYEWNTLNGKRESESVLKSCHYTGVCILADARTIFAVGTSLKEILDCQVRSEVSDKDVDYTALAVTRSGKVIFIGTSSGTVRAIKYPFSAHNEFIEYQAHCGPVTRMLITFDEHLLLTVSDDGCLLLWKITDKDGLCLRRDKDITYTEEILVTRADLEEKNQHMLELKTRVDELKMENEYQLRLRDITYNEKVKDLSDEFIREIRSLEATIQVMTTESERREIAQQKATAEDADKHLKELQDLESRNDQKLLMEYEKYDELERRCQLMQEEYEQRLVATEASHALVLEELKNMHEVKLQDSMKLLTKCQDEARQHTREFEEMTKQIEEDGDLEIYEIRVKYEKRLQKEKEINVKMEGEIGIMKKRLNSLQKTIDDKSADIEKLKQEKQKLHCMIRGLEDDIHGLEKAIAERDDTIHDKENRIRDLKCMNQELESFKFVLDQKIKELQKRIEPYEIEIKEMKEQIREMYEELERFHQKNIQLDLTVGNLKLKVKATDKEKRKEMQKVKDLQIQAHRFKMDLHSCMAFIQDPKKLKGSMKKLHSRYILEGDKVEVADVDTNIQTEFFRQREHLERTVASLKEKLANEAEVHQKKHIKIVRENMSLIKEINDLRKEVRLLRTRVYEYEIQAAMNKRSKSRGAARGEAREAAADPEMPSQAAPGAAQSFQGASEAERVVRRNFAVQGERISQPQLQDAHGQGFFIAPVSSSVRLPPLTG